MPVPDLKWLSYEVPADVGDSRRREHGALVAGDEPTIGVHIPDLRRYRRPCDKAQALLQTAAEVEHALLVQYLYAAFSLKGKGEQLTADQESLVDTWRGEIRHIAKQEMGHLITAQNMLLALSKPPNLKREGFPSIKDLYPFKFHLEPLSQCSLAKYVTAEAPQGAPGIKDIEDLADRHREPVNHVGNLYALLGVVVSTEEEVLAGGSGSSSWDQHLCKVQNAAYQQSAPQTWHLDDSAIDRQSLKYQATQDDWDHNSPDVTIFPIADRAAAREAIRKIAEQGEGPTDSGQASHFDRFLRIYRGSRPDKKDAFPPARDWKPARQVPIDPEKPPRVAANRTNRWAQLANKRYELLLAFIEAYLLTAGTNDRKLLAEWAKDDMFVLPDLSDKLETLPLNGGVAAPPFTLPHTLGLPPAEDERWRRLRARTVAAIKMVEAMRKADSADAHDPTLAGLLAKDKTRLDQIDSRRPQVTSKR